MRKKKYTEEEVIALLEKQREFCAHHLGYMNLACSYPEDFYTMYHWIKGTPLVLKLETPPKPIPPPLKVVRESKDPKNE